MLGVDPNQIFYAAAALVAVLALFGLLVWIFRRFSQGGGLGGGRRGRRLAVSEAAMVDKRRRLVLIRRDDSEHLLMIGGPQDVVIETGIIPPVPITDSPVAERPPAQTAQRSTPPPEIPREPKLDRPGRPLADPARPPAPPLRTPVDPPIERTRPTATANDEDPRPPAPPPPRPLASDRLSTSADNDRTTRSTDPVMSVRPGQNK